MEIHCLLKALVTPSILETPSTLRLDEHPEALEVLVDQETMQQTFPPLTSSLFHTEQT
jgi:hypothetical protein